MSRGRNAEAAEAIARILPSERTKLEQLAATAGTTVHNVSKLPQETRTMTVGMLILLFATLQQGGPAQHASLVLVGFIPFNLLMNLGPNATTFTML